MDSNKRIKELEAEIDRLKQKEKRFEHDIAIFHQVFDSMKKQFEQMKRELLKK
jgi:hypothetical protein